MLVVRGMVVAAVASLALVLVPGEAFAAPINDNFASATVITGASGTSAGTTVAATTQSGEPASGTIDYGSEGPFATVWYKWTAPAAGSTTFDTCTGTTMDSIMSVYTGTILTSLTRIIDDDDTSTCGDGTQSKVTFTAVAATVYSIQVDTFTAGSSTGPFTLTWSQVGGAPANDTFPGTTVTGASGTATGTNVSSTGQTLEPTNLGSSSTVTNHRSVWYTWVATSTASFTFDTCTNPASLAYDTTIGIYTGSVVSSLTKITDNDDATPACGSTLHQSKVTLSATSGTTYRIMVDGFGSSSPDATGNFVLTWAAGSTGPANDNFASRTTITGASGSINGTNVGATGETGEPVVVSGSTPRVSVWYGWTAPSSGSFSFDTCTGTAFDTMLGVTSASSVSGATYIASNDQFCSNQSKITFTAVSGTAYKIQVDGYFGATGTFTLTWSGGASGPANDNFASATTVSGNSGTSAGTNVSATAETGEPASCAIDCTSRGPNNSVWYKWTAPNGGTASFDLCTGTSFDSTLAVYTGSSLVTLSRVTDDDDTTGCGDGSQSKVIFTAVSGTVYSFQVASYTLGSTGAFTLTWSLPLPSITINDLTQAEGNAGTTAFNFTVTLSAASSTNVTVNYATADGTAVAPGDYAAVSATTLTFTAGQTTKTAAVNVNGDTTNEPNETFFVNLTSPSGATISDSQGLGTITNDDPVPSISINDVTQGEGNAGSSTFGFTVSLSNASSSTVTVAYSTADGTAGAPTDYTTASGTLTFNPGVTSQPVNVTVNGDGTFEPNETFFVNLSTPSGATISDGQGQGTITNDDPQPQISITDVSQNEGNAGTSNLDFTVSLSNPSSSTVTVNFATADGTAISLTGDYQAASGVVTFSPGQTSKTLTILVGGDTLFEINETFVVNLSGASGATISDNQGQATIVNDDAQLGTLSIDDVSHQEGNSGSTTYTFTVSNSTPTTNTITVDYATANGSATAPSDYTAASGTVTFPPLSTSQPVTITASGDTTFEPDENYFVNLSNAVNATIGDAQGEGSILNDDAQPSISVTNVSQAEGDSGTSSFVFSVTLSAASSQTVTVDAATGDGSAVAPGDYTPVSGTLTFTPGQTNKSVSVSVVGDVTFEQSENFFLNLSNQTNASIADNEGVGVIQNDDAQPAISVDDVSHSEGNAGTTTYDFTVSLSNPSAETVTVDTATSDGTATAPSDYSGSSGTVTFTPGQTSKTLSVSVNGDVTFEPDETFLVDVSNPGNASIADNQGVGTIVNDDGQSQVSISDSSGAEGNSGTTNFTFPVSLTNPSSLAVSVDYATADGTASSPDDYVSGAGTIIFPPGSTIQNIVVLVVGDVTFEPNEDFTVSLSNPSNATISDDTGLGTIQDDDNQPALSVGDVTAAEGNAGTSTFAFSVSLSNPSHQTITVNASSANGTAVAPGDYASVSGPLTFTPGQTAKTVSVSVNGDTTDELDETFTVHLSSPTNATLADDVGLGTIQNDDTAASLSVDDPTVVEGTGGTVDLTFTVSLTGDTAKTVTVDAITADGTATSPDDYDATTKPLTFAPGETTKAVDVVVNSDDVDEADETLTLNLSNSVNASLGDPSGTGTIVDDDGAPSIVVDDVTAPEGDFGPAPFTFTVSLSNPSSSTVTVDVATADGSATSPGDYTAVGGTLTFTPGQKQKTVNVPVKGDLIDETNETFHVNLSNPSGANIGDGSGLGTITDDDAAPILSVDDVSVTEGDTGTTDATFTVSLAGATEKTVTVGYATQDGSANAPDDYAAANDSLTFSPGDTSKLVSVHVKGDVLNEPDEIFSVVLANPSNATLGDDTGTGTILNDDGVPTLSIDDTQVTEGDSGTTNATFTVSLSSASGQQVAVDYATADGSATSPEDYNATGGTLTFTSGSTTRQFSVQVKGDTITEATESFTVNLSNASGATIADAQGQGTIVDDDGSADVSVSKDDSPDPVQVGSPLTYTVTVSNGGPAPATNVQMVDALPASVTFVSATPSQGTCLGTGPVNCNLGTLANGGTATVTIVVTPMRAGTIANIADVSADEVDGNQLNNEDKEFTEVVAAANGCTILGTSASETILGTAGDDVICAGGGDDTLKGYLGADTLRGEAGVDRLYGGAGNDVFDGGTGLDRVIFADFPAASAVFADLSGASPVCGGTPCSQNAELGHDTFITSGGLSTVEMLTGTKYGDTFIGDAGPNTLTGVDGPDTLTGGGGIDSLLGMAGNDTLGGQGEHDVLQGGPGNDSLDGGTDSDTASYYSDPGGATAVGTTITDGYGGTDTLISVENIQGSNAGNDSLTGTSVRDQMYGNGGNDSLIGLAGNDYLHGGVGTDTIDGGIGTDTCLAGETVTNCERSILQGPNQGNPDLPLLLAAQAAERQALVDSRSG